MTALNWITLAIVGPSTFVGAMTITGWVIDHTRRTRHTEPTDPVVGHWPYPGGNDILTRPSLHTAQASQNHVQDARAGRDGTCGRTRPCRAHRNAHTQHKANTLTY